MANCVVAQSGGPTAAINATLAGVIYGAVNSNIDKIFGAVNGIEGVINENFVVLNEKFDSHENLSILMQTPSSYLGSCRYKLPSDSEEIFAKIFDIFSKNDIEYFFYIGGNDSMDTVLKLSKYAQKINSKVKVMGIPKTIDNDLPCTDHTPGFGSAAKYIANTVREICCDSSVYDLKSCTIIEIMGRHAGWLTCASVLAKDEGTNAPHLIYLPEVPFDTEDFLKKVKEISDKEGNVIVCVSEGIKNADGEFICEEASSGLVDNFGHKCLSGTAKVLENLVRDRLGIKARGVEINVSQRCASHLASKTDIDESFEIGKQAVAFALTGHSGEMMVFKRKKKGPYSVRIESENIENAANKEKCVPLEWIKDASLTEDALTYLLPLVAGETEPVYENGIIKVIRR